MSWFALISLIVQVIRVAPELWEWVRKILDGIDVLKSPADRVTARKRLGQLLREHKDAQVCSVTCGSNLQAFYSELTGA